MQASLGPLAVNFSVEELSELTDSLSRFGWRCIRPRPGMTDTELPFAVTPVPWSPLGRFITDRDLRPGGLLNFAVGDYAVQDAASLLPLTLMQIKPGETIIDCCAAPGGKSAAILEQLNGSGILVSNEVIASRIETLQLTLGRTGQSNYMLTHQPVERLSAGLGAEFDCVLVDAPCTGQSLVARDKQSMSAFSDHQIAHSAARQRTILESAIQLVRPGGRLVYSTCTFAFEENEAIMTWLQEKLPGWQPVVLTALDAWQTPGHAGCYRVWPHRDHCAGGFAAALMRPEDDLSTSGFNSSSTSRSISTSRHQAWQAIDFRTELAAWGTFADDLPMWQRKQSVSWFSPLIPDTWRNLAWEGISLASQFGAHWQPAWPLATLEPTTSKTALSFEPHHHEELSDQSAMNFFTGTSLHLGAELKEGRPWRRVTWRDRPIAWSKLAAGQLKNHLPKPLRQPNLKLHTSTPT